MKYAIYKNVMGDWVLAFGPHIMAVCPTFGIAVANMAVVRGGAQLEPTC